MHEVVPPCKLPIQVDSSVTRCYGFTRMMSMTGSLLVIVGGVGALGGSLFDIRFLRDLFQPIQAYEALGYLLGGLALLLVNDFSPKVRFRNFVATSSAIILGGLSVITALQYFGGCDLKIDRFFYSAPFGRHMACQTNFSFLLLSFAVLFIQTNRVSLLKVAQLMSIVVFVCALGAVLGHVYDFSFLTKIGYWSQLSYPSAYLLIAVAIALFVARPTCGPSSLLISSTFGGMLARRLLPVTALTMAIFGTIHVCFPKTELLAFVILVFFVLPLLFWLAAALLEKVATEKRIARDDVQVLNRQLNEQVQQLLVSQQQINEALQSRSEFLARVSHELRTPLGGIISTAEMLVGTNLSCQQRELTEITLESGQHLLNLINDILDFSKIDAHKILVEKIDVDLYMILTAALESLRVKAEKKGLTILCGIGNDVPRFIKGDPGRIRQILTNLLDNAIKFTPQGQVILQVCSQSKSNGNQNINEKNKQVLYFQVKDTGIGIPPQLRERVFQPFVQADGSMTRKYGGSGLGLSICKSLVELMGGTIGFKSFVGNGSEFWFTIPLEHAPMANPGKSTASNLQSITTITTSKLILVVEDNQVNAKLAVLQLSKLGYVAEVARNGKEALEFIVTRSYALILMDVQMPEMDGLEATKQIRLRERERSSNNGRGGTHVPIIALTAHASAADREKCLCAGMDDYMTKPPALATLSDMVKRWIPPDLVTEEQLRITEEMSAFSKQDKEQVTAVPSEH